MKKYLIIILIVPILSFSQSGGTAILSINNGTININSSYLDSQYDDPDVLSLPYTGIDPIPVTVGNTSYVVKTAKFTGLGWDGEPGYYVIEISINNQIKFVHKQNAGLTYLNDGGYGSRLNQYADSGNNSFIKVPLSNEATALIFLGWPYANDPCQLLILVLTATDVKVVYNMPMNINSITQSGFNFSMITQSNVLEWSPNGGYQGTPITHTIYQQNGVLFLKI